MTDTIKRATRRLTDEQKAGIHQMLADKISHKEIMEKYGVSVGTISNMVKKITGKSSPKAEQKDSSNISALKQSLAAIKNRKLFVEELLNGALRQELEQLTTTEQNLERTIDSMIQLEAFTKNR